ncbi:hypothetical protein BC936DRAFT_149565 [Jimgerdemannia flammicorona]|uniref:Uncharacterized protein n=1 Tax=Jimgerdemannia flammicorona TaxID=994334 RepID=A0A433D0M8_9FUNG|nr:hypothetical protein BC936DRAFT_149565 [Jimgerdemannia flammicorona]
MSIRRDGRFPASLPRELFLDESMLKHLIRSIPDNENELRSLIDHSLSSLMDKYIKNHIDLHEQLNQVRAQLDIYRSKYDELMASMASQSVYGPGSNPFVQPTGGNAPLSPAMSKPDTNDVYSPSDHEDTESLMQDIMSQLGGVSLDNITPGAPDNSSLSAFRPHPDSQVTSTTNSRINTGDYFGDGSKTLTSRNNSSDTASVRSSVAGDASSQRNTAPSIRSIHSIHSVHSAAGSSSGLQELAINGTLHRPYQHQNFVPSPALSKQGDDTVSMSSDSTVSRPDDDNDVQQQQQRQQTHMPSPSLLPPELGYHRSSSATSSIPGPLPLPSGPSAHRPSASIPASFTSGDSWDPRKASWESSRSNILMSISEDNGLSVASAAQQSQHFYNSNNGNQRNGNQHNDNQQQQQQPGNAQQFAQFPSPYTSPNYTMTTSVPEPTSVPQVPPTQMYPPRSPSLIRQQAQMYASPSSTHAGQLPPLNERPLPATPESTLSRTSTTSTSFSMPLRAPQTADENSSPVSSSASITSTTGNPRPVSVTSGPGVTRTTTMRSMESLSSIQLDINFNPLIYHTRREQVLEFGGSTTLWTTLSTRNSDQELCIKFVNSHLRECSPNIAKPTTNEGIILYGYGLLHTAIVLKSLPLLSTLLQAGANPNAMSLCAVEDDKCTPLYLAAKVDWVEGLNLLVQYGADVGNALGHGSKKKTAFIVAAEMGRQNALRALIQAGAHGGWVNAPDALSITPVHWACWYNHLECVRILLSEGRASAELANKEGQTPLHFAASRGHVEIIACLVQEFRVSPNFTVGKMGTPLDAAKKANKKLAEQALRGFGGATYRDLQKSLKGRK